MENKYKCKVIFSACLCVYVLGYVVVYRLGNHTLLTLAESNAPPPVLTAYKTVSVRNEQDPSNIAATRPILRSSPQVRRYLTIRGNGGRLGNQMYVYASLLGIANATRMRPIENAYVKQVSLITGAFQLSSDVITKDRTLLRRKFTRLNERGPSIFTPELMAFHPNDTMLGGYLQSYKYFDHIASRLRRDFTFKDHIMTPAKTWVSQLLINHSHAGQTPTLVGLHVRRGLPARKGYKTPGVPYFERAMTYYKHKYPSALFVATNSEIDWVEEHLMVDRHDIVKTEKSNSAPLDMAILSLCNHTVMSVGTYGWWAAWLAGGDVVYLKNSTRPGTEAWKGFQDKDVIPENWIGME